MISTPTGPSESHYIAFQRVAEQSVPDRQSVWRVPFVLRDTQWLRGNNLSATEISWFCLRKEVGAFEKVEGRMAVQVSSSIHKQLGLPGRLLQSGCGRLLIGETVLVYRFQVTLVLPWTDVVVQFNNESRIHHQE